MPKIPMANKPGMIQHQRANVPMSGAPGMNFRMDEGAALSRLGQSIADTGEKLGRAGSRIVSAREDFYLQLQYTQDRLAATEARNLFYSINDELETRMIDNPAQFSKFGEWAAEADKKYADSVLDFTRKMSPDFRKQFDAEMAGIRERSLEERKRLGKRATVAACYNLFQSQWKYAALRGDLAECRRLLDYHTGKLISQQEREQKELESYHFADFGKVKNLIDAGSAEIAGELKAKDKNGNYLNFKALTISERDSFIRTAEANDARREAETDQKVLASFADGNILYSDEELKKQHEAGMLSDRQYHTYKGWNSEFLDKKKRAADYQATRQEKAVKANRQQQLDALFSRVGYDENGFSRTLDDTDFSDAFDKIKKICGKDYSLYDDAMQKLNALRKKDLSFRKTPLYKDGDAMITLWKKAGKMAAVKTGVIWDTSAGDTSDEANFFVERALRMDLENYCLEHPQANSKELYDHLAGKLEDYNRMELLKIITAGGRSVNKTAEANDPFNGEVRMGTDEERMKTAGNKQTPDIGTRRKTRDGRTAIFDGKGWKVAK